MKSIKDKWLDGTTDEIEFWRGWIPKNYREYEKPKQLRLYFGELIGDKKEVSILDVGAGAVSTIGYTWPNCKVNITLTDALAHEYNKIFAELGITPKMRVEYQDMTNINYRDGFFDIVNCRNALDHCIDPIQAIREMIRVCKPGGWVYLAHFSHEGKRQGYRGLHQWNLDGTPDGDCKIWNKYTSFKLLDEFPGFITEYAERKDGLQVGVSNKYHKESI